MLYRFALNWCLWCFYRRRRDATDFSQSRQVIKHPKQGDLHNPMT